jgi:hypothetical protein
MELEDHRVDKGARTGRVERIMYPTPKTRTEAESLPRSSAGVDGEESLRVPNDAGSCCVGDPQPSRDINCFPRLQLSLHILNGI